MMSYWSSRFDDAERLLQDHAEHRAGEVNLDRTAVDDDLARCRA